MARVASPLRYPGGKASMVDDVASILRMNGLERGHYIEPYAGGCGLALALLYGGHVADIHINDLDTSIWAFWTSLLHDTKAFLALVENTPVTIAEWLHQREIHRQADSSNLLKLGFSTFFLNRTNRSGIIKGAGVIGGIGQQGNYKLDCRYNSEELLRRIGRVAKYKQQIHLTNLDALEFLKVVQRDISNDALLFVDPPYYKKGAELYTSFYDPDDHAVLATKMMQMSQPWVLTYDDTPEIRALYRKRRQYTFDINYSLKEKRVGTELLVTSKGLKLPRALRERQVNTPQYRAA